MSQMVLLIGSVAYAAAVADHLTTPYDYQFESAAKVYPMDSNILRAIAKTENPKFDARAINLATKDYGLMQIHNTNLAFCGLDEWTALEPGKNILGAAKLITQMRKELGEKFSTISLFASYNAGTPAVKANPNVSFDYAAKAWTHYTLYSMGRIFA